jgi:hypothetical protein
MQILEKRLLPKALHFRGLCSGPFLAQLKSEQTNEHAHPNTQVAQTPEFLAKMTLT